MFPFQLRLCKGISYAAVAAHADKCGRRKLAAMLVEHEPRSSKQVPFTFGSLALMFSKRLKLRIFFSDKILLPLKKATLFSSSVFGQRKTRPNNHFTNKSALYADYCLTSGSSFIKHRRRRYSFDKGN